MAKKQDPMVAMANSKVLIQLIQSVEKLLLDPLWSSILGWQYVGENNSFKWYDQAALYTGIIDINRARADIDSTAALEVAKVAVDLAKSGAMDLSEAYAIARYGA